MGPRCKVEEKTPMKRLGHYRQRDRATDRYIPQQNTTYRNRQRDRATNRYIPQQTATYRNRQQDSATDRYIPQQNATYRNRQRHAATYRYIPQLNLIYRNRTLDTATDRSHFSLSPPIPSLLYPKRFSQEALQTQHSTPQSRQESTATWRFQNLLSVKSIQLLTIAPVLRPLRPLPSPLHRPLNDSLAVPDRTN
ncbi:hypothetical protein PoB_006237700 [Plakobranchus ocellatus]|uniref:Uncharacterized protein n=1 Tax=Plakobranchus ocellatus TaxID=259542 RepID=A0AAV4CVD0_9GAST|nr:hypothetical protein PoB_006237700 [Plakobranchus ocellatus]